MKAKDVTLEMLNAREIRENEKKMRQPDWRGLETSDGPLVPRRCGEIISSGRATYHCSREALFVMEPKSGGRRFLCKQHLTGKKRSYANDQTWREEQAAEKALEQGLDQRLGALGDRLGFEIHKHYRSGYRLRDSGHSDTTCEVNIDDLEALADRLTEAVSVIEGLADQQAMPDEWYREPLDRIRGD